MTTDEARERSRSLYNFILHANANAETRQRVIEEAIRAAAETMENIAKELAERLAQVLSLHYDPCPYDAATTRTVARQTLARAIGEGLLDYRPDWIDNPPPKRGAP